MITFLIEWQALVIPSAVLIISQFIKVALESKRDGFQWKHLNSYGGMPSSHTAFCVSVAIMAGILEGFTSPVFAVAAMVCAVFIRDAVGIRWSLGFHGKVINHLIQTLPAEERTQFPKKLEERLGHRPLEALAGGIIGTVLTIVFYIALASLATK